MNEFSPLQIGNVKTAGPAVLAPMAGITDAPFRKVVARFGAGMVVSEMVASASLTTGQAEMVRRLEKTGGLPHIVQLAGNEVDWMVRGAKIAADAGADVIDINLGCPAKRVTNGYAGCALMRQPDFALELIEAVLGEVDLPVTVKMRLGWDDDTLNAAELAARAEAAGVNLVTVHGRTRQQFYKGAARWEPVRDVVNAVTIPVLVNGDIIDLLSARIALEKSEAAGVMIGRGAQGRPWIVGQISAALMGLPLPRAPEGVELADLIAEHYSDILSHHGRELGIRVARKHVGWYLEENLPEHSTLWRKSILTSLDPHHVLREIRAAFVDAEQEAA
ncbi:MAG: tRNA dihydrouridine synthase DusB [Hyphomicrobiaceae bacterium]|nr:tRNA dihydrouridine synthase DusB [Hyphomicrobiaceae bacterium]MCC0023445.1 tRNA dihydrouridine synthase DusB [Hyphomicrobiaceae bacterium]